MVFGYVCQVIKLKAFKKGCESIRYSLPFSLYETIKKEMMNFHTIIDANCDWLESVLELPFVGGVKAFIL
jgi:hypothetical protein